MAKVSPEPDVPADARSGAAHAANLVGQGGSGRWGVEHDVIDDVTQDHQRVAGPEHFVAEDLIVRVVVEGGEAPDLFEHIAAHGHRGPEREAHAFQHVHDYNAEVISTDMSRASSRDQQAAARHATIEASSRGQFSGQPGER